jgi:asparagine synthase (glutamine-hydrolysing)
VITFNGEIYNWRELRGELQTKGHAFLSGTDTEVVLAAWRQWGEECLDRLSGMFAFAIWDPKREVLLCARDPVGKKPFVYAETARGFYFASELPAVRSLLERELHLDHAALAAMLLHNLRHIPDPCTAYREMRRLRPGHAISVRCGRVQRMWQWWRPSADAGSHTPRRLRALIEEAVQKRMVADVPVGALLSGGVDSSAIVAIMAKQSREPIRTYAVGFDMADEDLRRARAMAKRLGCHHKELYFDPDRQLDNFRTLIRLHGEPIMLLPLAYTMQLSEAIRDDGIKVVLAGHGADELFYGYTGHVRTAWMSLLIGMLGGIVSHFPAARRGPLAVAAAPRGQRKAAYYHLREATDWDAVLRPEARIGLQNVVAEELARWGSALDNPTFLDESNFVALMVENTHSVSTATDLPAMAASIEMRAPFLDRDVISFALGTPWWKKVPLVRAKRRLKLILREAVDDLVPHDLLYAPKRGFGFGIPQDRVLQGPWRGFCDALFESPNEADGLFDARRLRQRWERYKVYGSEGSNLLPNMVGIQYWLQNEVIQK